MNALKLTITLASFNQISLLAERHLQHYKNWALSQIDDRKLLQVERCN